MDWGKVNWGDVPSWVNVLVTACALVAAVVAVRASWHVLEIEREREKDRVEAEVDAAEAAERAVQADRVAVWHDEVLDTRRWGAIVVNDNALPIYDVVVEFYGPDDSRRADVIRKVVPPGKAHFYWPEDLRARAATDEGGNPIFTEAPSDFQVGIRFRDVTGRVWHRDRRGYLWLIAYAGIPDGRDGEGGSPRIVVEQNGP